MRQLTSEQMLCRFEDRRDIINLEDCFHFDRSVQWQGAASNCSTNMLTTIAKGIDQKVARPIQDACVLLKAASTLYETTKSNTPHTVQRSKVRL